jgi:hypothetical protein
VASSVRARCAPTHLDEFVVTPLLGVGRSLGLHRFLRARSSRACAFSMPRQARRVFLTLSSRSTGPAGQSRSGASRSSVGTCARSIAPDDLRRPRVRTRPKSVIGPGCVKMRRVMIGQTRPVGLGRPSHARIASINPPTPRMRITRFMLYARTCSAISVPTFLSVFIWKCVDPIQDFIVPNGCSTV